MRRQFSQVSPRRQNTNPPQQLSALNSESEEEEEEEGTDSRDDDQAAILLLEPLAAPERTPCGLGDVLLCGTGEGRRSFGEGGVDVGVSDY